MSDGSVIGEVETVELASLQITWLKTFFWLSRIISDLINLNIIAVCSRIVMVTRSNYRLDI